jgi:hypothetical protein
MSLAETIKKIEQETGYVEDEPARAVEEHEGWHYGERVRIVEDDDDEGLFADDTGYLILSEVGARKYGNLHTKPYFLPDGMDTPLPVSLDNIEPE